MRKDMPEEQIMPMMATAMPGIEERELTDEELLGEATLAKISTRPKSVELEEEPGELAIEDEDLVEDIEEIEEVIEVNADLEFTEEDDEEEHEIDVTAEDESEE
jgi:hypothetical protein